MKSKIILKNKTILVTGAAGFIGANLVMSLLQEENPLQIIGIDNLNDYYDVSLKEYRLSTIQEECQSSLNKKWVFIKGDIADSDLMEEIFETYRPQIVVNLAAQAGVRYSITNPDVYMKSNIIGFHTILEKCRKYQENIEHLVYASSSSVYGGNTKIPFSELDAVDNPVSLYAVTKKTNELEAHAYSKLYNIPTTGLRFFTVYGPAGRPDMAYFSFTKQLIDKKPIEIFNYGNCQRDFTYIDDIVEGVKRVMAGAPQKEIGEDGLPIPPYAIYNIGNHQPENLLNFVEILQEKLIAASILPEDYDFSSAQKLVPMQAGDVVATYADISLLEKDFNFKPKTSLRNGLRNFAEWYRNFYQRGE